ncbi:MAG: radical SAM/SPASM domain-containing protein [Candidatus Bathyarchaeia archaeon]
MKSGQLTAKILAGFLRFKARRHRPLFASYNVTGRCNMKCSFCDWWKKDIPELPTKKALTAIDEVCSLGVPFFDFSGGEPLLRKDLSILAKRASSHGCLVSMNTNGALLKSGRASEIREAFDIVVVSLDGPKEVHDKLRGVEGTYDRAIEAIKLLKACGVRVGVNMVVTPWNIKILPKFVEWLRSLVDFAQVQPIHPYPPPPQNKPSFEAVSELSDYLLKLKRSSPGFLAVPTDFVKGFKPFFEGKAPKICHAGGLYVAIDPMGRLLACPARADVVLGNLLTHSAAEILKEKTKSPGWLKVSSCEGCWLECTAGFSIAMENPLKEALRLTGLF